ncbi:MAG: sensor histidine kinase [Deltaproteobacteria bacterium]|nr:sensor histidine kinase [Deltaproteobacteria bacterium]
MPDQGTRREFYRRALTLALLVCIVSLLHYGTRTTLPLWHDVYRRLYYLPVGLAAVWFGVRGGLWVSSAVAVLYVPHIFLGWHHASREVANQLMEIALYFVFSGLIGHFADQEKRFRGRWREAAEKLDRSYQELKSQADLILEIDAQLRRADRLSATGQLASALTHEIRNPLAAIRGTAEILQDAFPIGHPKAEFFDILVRETERLNRVVEDFLGLTRPRPEGDGAELVDLGELAQDTANLVATQVRKAGLSAQTDLPAGLLVRGSPVQLKQVLLNLLLNAIQATPTGHGLIIQARALSGTVQGPEYREVEGRLIALTVEDEGPGISEELLPRIFEPFFTTKSEGTGLGLAISLRIAQAHGGTLTAENRPEGGARFTLTLPLFEEPEPEEAEDV